MAKIIIIGAGISGLSTYLFLRKHLLLSNPTLSSQEERYEIKIYEAYDIHPSSFSGSRTNPTTGDSVDGSTTDPLPAETEPIFTPQAIGSAIGISRNGLNVLARLGEPVDYQGDVRSARSSLVEQMVIHGHPIERWEISTARGFTLVEVDLARVTQRPAPHKHGQSEGPITAAQDLCRYHAIMIARQSCWEILRDHVLRDSPDVVVHKKVVDVVIGDERTRNVVKFEDGSQEEADLVIGADGLRSVLRRAMFRTGEGGGETNAGAQNREGRSTSSQTREGTSSWLRTVVSYFRIPFFKSGRSADAKAAQRDYISPHYEGLVGVGGFVPSSVLEATGHKPGTMAVVFGPNGFFGYGYLTSSTSPTSLSNNDTATRKNETTPLINLPPPPSAPGPLAGWWSTFSSPTPFPYSTSASSSPSPSPAAGGVLNTTSATNMSTVTSTKATRKPTEFNKPLALAALLGRHAKWHNPTIQAILSFVEQDTATAAKQQQQQQKKKHSPAVVTADDDDNGNLVFNGKGKGKGLDAAYPTWTTPELPSWSSRGRAVLVGDAAHALQPSSGQGACQALEDAEALALFLRHYLSASASSSSSSSSSSAPAVVADAGAGTVEHSSAGPPAPAGPDADAGADICKRENKDQDADTHVHASLQRALDAFETLRKPRVHAIYTRSQKMSRMKGDMGVLAEWAMYLVIYLMTWFRDSYNEELLAYDLPREVEKALERERSDAR
ncbi:uncharacterized protein Z519_07625 [Cladophialophora bantiana CBS 173.52]|uniref:FAD-binding domain-containing protein n=1 Tax=Cladophialophora bantiana (strain ATCC 10958 / CBS 173.52 / CDC B-1940 / NIH 8579) TaxID=1442370 RepID=A0A0D2FYX3_CLAB1|nr:uncharacterized protein Z519_07625 [Cladophialophora bantiana CBS 173.52]KIW91657.1 hypothetical protein Z519_07625 [Cladophialophora bantiana CBS 173.52]